MSQRFVIPGRFISFNDFDGMDRFERREYKKVADEMVWAAVKQFHIRPYSKPIMYSILWVEQSHRRDLDNIAFAKKFIQDGLVKAGIIKDDSGRYIKGFSDSFDYDPRNPRIEVEIYEA